MSSAPSIQNQTTSSPQAASSASALSNQIKDPSKNHAPSKPAHLPLAGSEVWKELLLTRLPIFDMQRQTIGYELRGQGQANPAKPAITPSANTPIQTNPDAQSPQATQLTRQCIHHALHVVSLEPLLGDARLFMTMTAENMLQADYALLPAQRTCLHLANLAELPEQLIAACHLARKAGFTLSFDTQCAVDHGQAIFDLAQFLQVDIHQASAPMLEALIQRQNQGGPSLLATGLHSQQDMTKAAELGVRYAQGQFFCEPQIVQGKELAASQIIQLKFLAQLNKPQLDFDELQETIKCDVALTCNLLRYLNSAAMGVKNKITSVKQALVLLGEKPMRQWGSLVAITALAGDKPHELLVTSLVRARFCETLAQRRHMDDEALDLFLTGLLSTLDVMLDMPMEAALATLPLPEQVSTILLQGSDCDMGKVFKLVTAAQRGAWGSVLELGSQLHLPHHEMASEYYKTLQWTHNFFKTPD